MPVITEVTEMGKIVSLGKTQCKEGKTSFSSTLLGSWLRPPVKMDVVVV